MAAAAASIGALGALPSRAWAEEAQSPTAPSLASRTPAEQSRPALAAPSAALMACPFAGDGLRVTLRRVRVTGATLLQPRDIDRAVADLIGKDNDLAVVCVARDRIARLFTDRGFRLTRVEIAPQHIQNGELTLSATLGYVGRVRTAGLAPLGPSAPLARDLFEPLVTRRPTPWAAIEGAVLAARDIRGAEVDVQLRPATDLGPGALELDARASRRRIDLSTGVRDMGSSELGQVAGVVRIDGNSFTRLAERTSVLIYATTTGRQKVSEGIESANLIGAALRGQIDLTYAQTAPAGRLAALGLNGDFLDARLGFTHAFLRTYALEATGSAGFEWVDQRNSLGACRVWGCPGAVP